MSKLLYDKSSDHLSCSSPWPTFWGTFGGLPVTLLPISCSSCICPDTRQPNRPTKWDHPTCFSLRLGEMKMMCPLLPGLLELWLHHLWLVWWHEMGKVHKTNQFAPGSSHHVYITDEDVVPRVRGRTTSQSPRIAGASLLWLSVFTWRHGYMACQTLGCSSEMAGLFVLLATKRHSRGCLGLNLRSQQVLTSHWVVLSWFQSKNHSDLFKFDSWQNIRFTSWSGDSATWWSEFSPFFIAWPLIWQWKKRLHIWWGDKG